MITKKRKIGNTGEEIACKYLENKGFKVLERNYLRKWGEIDIIAQKEGIVHFIEVKSVSREMPVESAKRVTHETEGYRPEDNVNKRKLSKIARTIQTYLADKNISMNSEWRFDIATVFIDFKRRIGRVKLIKDIII